jgi:hypothetical protein
VNGTTYVSSKEDIIFELLETHSLQDVQDIAAIRSTGLVVAACGEVGYLYSQPATRRV